MVKKHDAALTPHQRAARHPDVRKQPVISMNAQFKRLKPAALSRQVLALTGQLEALSQAKAAPRGYKINTLFNSYPKRTFSSEATSSLPGPIDVRQQVRGGGQCPKTLWKGATASAPAHSQFIDVFWPQRMASRTSDDGWSMSAAVGAVKMMTNAPEVAETSARGAWAEDDPHLH
ncbi:hypothetical protein FHJ30_20170 [Arthrobacter sp. BB-1]|uniref:hypothetical protein n=1 Tax=unclassified Arthrobacter TaxID=235627 RepID=UPI0010E4E54A|nr:MULTISPECIES: hypothetical protein [unclassified Arthrobacter]TNB67770.1 hypothetical protein FHJ30_20170 [Arthrobacter sp. BB-1]VII98555.1 hypothetical protein [Arthrobacter sp. DR-2P]